MRRLVFGALLAALAATLAAGCGGGGSTALSKEEYVAKLNQICADFNTKQDEIGSPSDLEEFATKGSQVRDEFDKAIADAKKLNPPDEIKDQVDRFISLGEQERDLLSELVAAAKDGDATKVQDLGNQLDPLDQESDAIATELGAPACAQNG